MWSAPSTLRTSRRSWDRRVGGRCASPGAGSAAGAGGGLPAGLEVVEGTGHVLGVKAKKSAATASAPASA